MRLQLCNPSTIKDIAVMILRFSLMLLIANYTMTQSLELQPNGAVTRECGKQQQLICTSSSDITWQRESVLTSCTSTGCLFSTKEHYIFNNSGSNFYMTFNPLKSVDNGKTFTCSDTGTGIGTVVITTKVNFDQATCTMSATEVDSSVTFKFTTNCIRPAASATYYWKIRESEKLIDPKTTNRSIEPSGCNAGDCTGDQLIVLATFTTYSDGKHEHLELVVTFDGKLYSFPSNKSYIFVKVPFCLQHVSEPVLFGIWVAMVIIVVIIFVCSEPDLEPDPDSKQKKQLMWRNLIIFFAIVMFAIAIVATILLALRVAWCEANPKWCIALSAVTMIGSWLSVIVTIPALWHYIIGKWWENEEDPAALPLVMIGFPILFFRKWLYGRIAGVVEKYWFPKDTGEHSHGQSTGHSDRGGDKRVGVSKRNDEHSKILMSTSGNANQQPRAQPPLPGISKSHQQLDEPHNKKTRGLSSNFEDPNSLPQFEARKHSLAPINATAEGDSDSTARKKKKKKKKKEGSDTARSDED